MATDCDREAVLDVATQIANIPMGKKGIVIPFVQLYRGRRAEAVGRRLYSNVRHI